MTTNSTSAERPTPALAKELGVTYLLEGSVQEVTGQIRVTVQLTEGMTETHLSSETYEANADSFAGLSAEIAQSVTTTVDSY